MKSAGRLVQHAAGLLTLAASFCLVAQAQELSHARIVRLSFAEGVVTVYRPDAGEWAKSSVNTPIQEGFKVATDDGGFAEIEFENASTARIGQATLLEFTQLALLPSGGKVNRMTLVQGYGSFNIIPEGDDSYEVTAGTATLTTQGKSRFRVDLENGIVQVKVFKGSIEIMSPEGTGTLGKNTVLEIRPDSEQPFEISQGITKDDWDKWVEEREDRTEMVRNMGVQRVFGGYTNNATDLLWGAMDLMYYGTWFSDPLYGYGWAPTAGPGWSPYTNGRWTWYPGWGYTWIGMEPWGWLPYHYGSWTYNAGIGWCWFPMGGFNTWSPATVNWYQGSGWVGWSPRGAFSNNCPRADGCVAIAPEGRLTGGQSIQPGDLRWGRNHDLGQPVERVNLSAGREAMMAGTAYDFSRGFNRNSPSREQAGPGNEGGITVIGGTAGGRQGVVYDPISRTYVNNAAAPRTRENPDAAGSPEMISPSSRGGFSSAPRPGPANNYPVFPTQTGGRQSGGAPRGEASRSTSGGDNGDWIRSTAVGWGNNSDSRSSSSGRSDSGSRSSASSGTSSSSGSSRSSGSSPGGWGGGGSSGSGRSSGGGSSSGSSGSWGGGGGHSSGGGGGFGGGGGGHSSGGGGGYGGGGGGYGGGGGGGHSSGGGGSSSSGSSRR